MANTVNIYSTRTMMTAIEKMMPVRSFFLNTFFSEIDTKLTEDVDVDFKKGKRVMAPFVAPRVGGVVMDRQGYTTRSYKVPKIAPERVISIDDINKRSMGENVYSINTPEERAAILLGKDLSELDESISRREEWMCRELLINGKITMKGIIDDKTNKTIEQEVDYGFTNKETLSGAAKWDTTTADIYGDIKRWRLDIIKSSGKAPNVLILASNVVDLIRNNAAIQKVFDVKNFNFGAFDPKIKGDAVTFVMYLAEFGLEVYSYDEWFIDDAGTEQPFMPDSTVIMARVGMGKRLYGAISHVEDTGFVTYEGTRIPKRIIDSKNDTTLLRLSSRPLPVPEDVDDWFVGIVK